MKTNSWYDEKIEAPVRNLVKYLRNNGVNTECSCGHDMYIQCQYIPDGSIMELHKLLFDYMYEKKMPINYEIVLTHKVIDGHSYSHLNTKLEKAK